MHYHRLRSRVFQIDGDSALLRLPIEIRERIMFSLSPIDRLNCRLVCRQLCATVKGSMRDVVSLNLMHASTCNKLPTQVLRMPTIGRHRMLQTAIDRSTSSIDLELKPKQDDAIGDSKKSKTDSLCRAVLTTVNPYTSIKYQYTCKLAPNEVGSLLELVGARLETLTMNTYNCLAEDNAMLTAIRLTLESLIDIDTCPCPLIANLSIDSCYLINGDGLLRLLLIYAKSRRHRSLLSLSLTANRAGCCEERTARFLRMGPRFTMYVFMNIITIYLLY